MNATTLNIGAGTDIQPDAHNVDCVALEGIDEVVDLDEYPWPWDENEFTTVLAKHVLEHLENPMQAIREICRVTKPGGRVEIWYPIGHTRFEDPTHKHYWNWNTAETLAGERKHSHEHTTDLKLHYRTLDWNVDTPHWRVYTNLRLWAVGRGPWLSQIPGLYGTVKAVYSIQ